MFTPRILKIVLLSVALLAAPAFGVEDNPLSLALQGILTQAEEGLAEGELELAESHYREALLEET